MAAPHAQAKKALTEPSLGSSTIAPEYTSAPSYDAGAAGVMAIGCCTQCVRSALLICVHVEGRGMQGALETRVGACMAGAAHWHDQGRGGEGIIAAIELVC